MSNIPEEIQIKYKLNKLATPDGSIYIQANKGMYGLTQSGLLANKLLEKKIKQTCQSTKLINTRPMETQNLANTTHIGYRQLWGQIHTTQRCPTYPTSTGAKLQNNVSLNRHTIHWIHT